MTEDGQPYGPARYKEIAHERYLISKHTNTSYSDTGNITPIERKYIIEFIVDDLQRQKDAYEKASKDISADKIIPSGEFFHRMEAQGAEMYRDGKHASFGVGRYGLGLLWYACLTGKDISDNTFRNFDEEISEEDISVIKKCVNEVMNGK